MIQVKETASRLILTGLPAELERLRQAYRIQPPEYWRSARYQLYKQTKGERGWDGFLYPFKLISRTTAIFARGHLEDLKQTSAMLEIQLDLAGVLRRPYGEMTVDDIPDDIVVSDNPPYPHQVDGVLKWMKYAIGINQITVAGGKTRCGAMVAAVIKRKIPKARVLYLVPTERLVKQATKDTRGFLPDWDIGQYGGSKREPDAKDMVIATYAIIGKNFSELEGTWLKSFTVLIVDECFPAGTLVDDVPIELIKSGDRVMSFDGITLKQCVVSKTFKSKPSRLLKLELSNGITLACTPNHPIRTSKGFIPALRCEIGTMVCTHSHAKNAKSTRLCSLQVVQKASSSSSRVLLQPLHVQQARLCLLFENLLWKRKRISSNCRARCDMSKLREAHCLWFQNRRNYPIFESYIRILLGDVQARIFAPVVVDNGGQDKSEVGIHKDENQQPNSKTWRAREDFESNERPCIQEPPWKWVGTDAAPDNAVQQVEGTWTHSSNGTSDRIKRANARISARSGADATAANELSSRYSDRRVQVSDRGGRKTSSYKSSKTEGWLEDSPLEFVRVDRVEVLEPTGDGTFGGVCSDGFVYNLEVEGEHNYFANGVLVHNCHHAASATMEKIVTACPCFFKFGMTDSAKEDDPIRGFKIRGLLGPVLTEMTAGPMIADGRLATPKIYLVDVPEWQNRFEELKHQAEPNTPAWAFVNQVWKKAIYLGPAVERHTNGSPRLTKTGEEIQALNLHRLQWDGMETDVESRWVLLERSYDRGIIRFRERNELVTRWATYFSGQKKKTLVVCTRTLHILILQNQLEKAIGADLVRILFSEHSSGERDETFEWFKSTPGSVLITPLLKEGVSINEITAGVVADYVGTVDVAKQLIGRFIRKKLGGEENHAEIVWFIDRQIPTYRRGSLNLFRELEQVRGYEFYHPVTEPGTQELALKFEARTIRD